MCSNSLLYKYLKSFFEDIKNITISNKYILKYQLIFGAPAWWNERKFDICLSVASLYQIANESLAGRILGAMKNISITATLRQKEKLFERSEFFSFSNQDADRSKKERSQEEQYQILQLRNLLQLRNGILISSRNNNQKQPNDK